MEVEKLSDLARDIDTDIYMSRGSYAKEESIIEDYLNELNKFNLNNLYDLLDGLRTELNDKGAGIPYNFDSFFSKIYDLIETAEEWK